jgi:hypothetical protein
MYWMKAQIWPNRKKNKLNVNKFLLEQCWGKPHQGQILKKKHKKYFCTFLKICSHTQYFASTAGANPNGAPLKSKCFTLFESFKLKPQNLARIGSIVVEQSPRHPKVEGLNPTAPNCTSGLVYKNPIILIYDTRGIIYTPDQQSVS